MTVRTGSLWTLAVSVTALSVLGSLISIAHAQTVVLACPGWWGVSDGISTSCTGCSAPIWTAPDAEDAVKTDASPYWAKLGTLASTARVITNSGKAEGSTANCADTTNVIKTVGELSGTVPAPVPTPTATGSGQLNWSAPSTNRDGTTLTNLSGYRIEYGQGTFGASVTVGVVTSYMLTSLAVGTWQARVVTLAGAAESTPSNAVTFDVSPTPAPEPTPVPTPTPTPAWVVAPVSSNSRPVYEPVQNASSTALVRGTVQGQIAVNKPCGAERLRVGTNSYRDITEADATLDSPTYKGRQHVAICVKQ